MRCEVLAVGTELLLGQIVDSNSAWIGEQLALSGIDCLYQAKVGDNLARIVEALRAALARADAVIVCGGLGPTQDDLTRDAIARLMDAVMVRDETVVAAIRERFASRGRTMPDNNLRQADVPTGASLIPEMPGTAPGLICPIGDKVVYAVPGVPWEMKAMITGTVLPDLIRRAGARAVIASRTLRTWGESESGLAERLAPRISELDATGNPTLAFLASGIEGLKVRITAKADSQLLAEAMLGEEESRLRDLLGSIVFGVDEQTMESVVLDALTERNLTLAVAESLTGGLVGARLTAVPGCSAALRGCVVSYASAVKFDLLAVPEGPVVCATAAKAMAEGVRRLLKADVGLATTGVAGPDTQEGQPVGTVFLGLALGDHVEAVQVNMPGNREQIRQFTVISLLDLLRRRLAGLG